MAGEFPGGRAAANRFRNGIRLAMDMGLDPSEGDRVTFLFAPQLVWTGTELPTDEDGLPFDPVASVQEQRPTPVQVTCSVTYFDARNEEVPFGNQSATRVEVMLLDEEYEQVKDAVSVMIHGDLYKYVKTEPPQGMFSVGIYTLHFDAVTES